MNIKKIILIVLGLLLLVASVFAYDCNGSLALWHLDYTSGLVVDACGGNSDKGNLGATRGIAGIVNKSFDFELLETDYVTIVDNDSLDIDLTKNLTVALWAKLESVATTQWLYMKGDNANVYYGVFFSAGAGEYGCYIWNGIGADVATCLGTDETNKWVRVVCNFNTTNVTAYCNTTMGQGIARTAGSATNADNFTFGARKNGAGYDRYFDGLLDHIRVYSVADVSRGYRELSPAEIALDWQYGNISGLIGPIFQPSCNITLISPANGSTSTTSAPTFTANLTCFHAMPERCYLTMNSTGSGQRTTGFSNGSTFSIVANTTKANGFYYWNVTCLNNTAPSFVNTSGTFNLTINVSVIITEIIANINVEVDSTTEKSGWTTAICNNNYIDYVYTRTVCIEGTCKNVNITERERCELGCIDGTRMCRQSLLRANPILTLLVALIILLVFVYLLYNFFIKGKIEATPKLRRQWKRR